MSNREKSSSTVSPGEDNSSSTASLNEDNSSFTTSPGGDNSSSTTSPGGDTSSSTTSPGGDNSSSTVSPGGDNSSSTASLNGDNSSSTTSPGGDNSSSTTSPIGDNSLSTEKSSTNTSSDNVDKVDSPSTILTFGEPSSTSYVVIKIKDRSLVYIPEVTNKLRSYRKYQWKIIALVSVVYWLLTNFTRLPEISIVLSFFCNESNSTYMPVIVEESTYFSNLSNTQFAILIACKTASAITLTFTVGVYMYLDKLRTVLHGKFVMYYLITMTLYYICTILHGWLNQQLSKLDPWSWRVVNICLLFTTVWLTMILFDTWIRVNRPIWLYIQSNKNPATPQIISNGSRKLKAAYIAFGCGYSLILLSGHLFVDNDFMYFVNVCYALVFNLVICANVIIDLQIHRSNKLASKVLFIYNVRTYGSIYNPLKITAVACADFSLRIVGGVLVNYNPIIYFVCDSVSSLSGVFLMLVLIGKPQIARLIAAKWRGYKTSN